MRSVSLLFGKRPLQRVIAGASQQKIEIPLDLVADIPAKVRTGSDCAESTGGANHQRSAGCSENLRVITTFAGL